MCKHEFKVGDKVKLPKTKSCGEPIYKSNIVAEAKSLGQDYLYITKRYDEGELEQEEVYVLNTKNYVEGDFFLMKDLIPYIEQTDKEKYPIKKFVNELGHTVIINYPAVIYIIPNDPNGVGGKGIAMCDPNDKFEPEKWGVNLAYIRASRELADNYEKWIMKQMNKEYRRNKKNK